MAKAEYDQKLRSWQDRLAALSDCDAFRDVGLILAFEGHDAAGKGGSIRRVTQALDPRRYQIHPIAAPSDEERAQPYLWRYWRRLPRRGDTAIFDRTWYGRVLVERVEGYCSEAEWLRAYGEINDFDYKITDEDRRNREKWDQYVEAVGDMVDRTSTAHAPWTMVETEDKRHARLKVLETVCARLEAALG